MTEPTLALIGRGRRSNWVRLRAMTGLRWIALAGQIAAILVGKQYYHLSMHDGMIFVVIGALAISNLVAMFVYPENKRLSESELLAILLFDVAQLASLLGLTGGLHNPFSLLILAPVTISATTLHLRSTLAVGALAIVLISVVGLWNVPLHRADGHVMQIPPDFVFGFWVAIVIGIVFQAVYARRITIEVNAMSDALVATQLALAREQKLTDLGGVVAAAAHELGSPLATIKLVSSELLEELDDADQKADARLIRDQADRCRDILRSMGRAGKDDLHLRHAPLASLVQEAAEPHLDRGREILWHVAPAAGGESDQPVIRRRPEIIHGVRNLVQNAVDFAESSVWIDIAWDERQIMLRISDDGAGFSAQVLPRLGDPFLRRRDGRRESHPVERPGYEGMGLGLFIAKTLLERSGAELSFANGPTESGADPQGPARRGAVVEVVWRRSVIAEQQHAARPALGENRPLAH